MSSARPRERATPANPSSQWSTSSSDTTRHFLRGRERRSRALRKRIGYSDLAKLVIAIERCHLTLEGQHPSPRSEEVTTDTLSTEAAAQLTTI